MGGSKDWLLGIIGLGITVYGNYKGDLIVSCQLFWI